MTEPADLAELRRLLAGADRAAMAEEARVTAVRETAGARCGSASGPARRRRRPSWPGVWRCCDFWAYAGTKEATTDADLEACGVPTDAVSGF